MAPDLRDGRPPGEAETYLEKVSFDGIETFSPGGLSPRRSGATQDGLFYKN